MTQDTSVAPEHGIHSEPGPALLAAAAVVVLGTAWVDPTRLSLLLVPVMFVIFAYGAGLLMDRAVGGLLLATEHGDDLPPMLLAAMNLAVGLGGIVFLAATTALCGVFEVAGVMAVPVVGYGLLHCVRGMARIRFAPPALPSVAGGAVLGAAWLVTWLWGTIPPVFFDELVYHLVIPQQALITGGLPAWPWVFFSLMPYGGDLLLAWGMLFSNELGARATHAAVWVLCSLVAWGLAEAIAWPRATGLAGPLVAGALASSPTLWFLSTLPFSETSLSVALAAAMAVLVLPHETRRSWVAFGVLLGLAMSVKLSGLFWAVAAYVAAIVSGWPVRDLVRSALIAVGSVAPWWIHAFVHTGNPIYPMAYGLLGGGPWSQESYARLMGDLPPGAADLGLTGLARLPLDLAQHPERFGSASEAGLLAWTAVGMLVLFPLMAWRGGCGARERLLSRVIATFLLVAGVGWVMTSVTVRFFGPALVIGLAGCAGLVLCMGRVRQRAAVLATVVVGLWGTWQFITQHESAFSSRNVALGREHPERYVARQVDHVAAAHFVRENLPPDAVLLFIGETRPYYFFRAAVAPSAIDRHPLERWIEESSSARELAARLAHEGITHVVLNARELKRLREQYGLLAFQGAGAEAKAGRFTDLLDSLQLLFSANRVFVFAVPK